AMNETSSTPSWRPPNHVAKWLPAVAAAGLLGTVIVAGVALGGGGDSSVQQTDLADSAFVVDTGVTALTVPDSVPDVIGTVETSLPVDKTVLQRNLSKGLAGDDVKQVQLRLTDLGFVPGPADGIYGDQTVKAVWAYEKLVLKRPSNDPTGRVTPEMWDAMQEPFVIQPRRPNATPNHTEVYLPEQVLAIFHDDKPAMITHMSSGSNEQWCEEVTISPGEYGNREGTEPLVRGECGISNTPGGVFTVYREVEGIRESALGGMWNPVYFNYGIAIHGALNVPLQGASHGCIRIPLNISETMQELMGNGDQVFVWDGENEPEAVGSPPPTFNWLDPDYESTSTTTTTTVAETTTTTEPAVDTTVASTSPATTVAATTTTTAVPDTTSTTTTITTVAAGGSEGEATDDGGADAASGG
ncbi:MAG: L,D-transpeptidase family protein, partial [Ilumatobacter sp.]|nr:L,D-transpeptidase family protein [Ilumatobacter sp.]